MSAVRSAARAARRGALQRGVDAPVPRSTWWPAAWRPRRTRGPGCCANVGGLRLAGFFGFATVFWVLVTGLLATWNTCLGAADHQEADRCGGAAFPAALLFLRYRWLQAEPLPRERVTSGRRLPPPGRRAAGDNPALGASEREFGVVDRGDRARRVAPGRRGQ